MALVWRSQSSTAGDERIAGTTTTRGFGASATEKSGTMRMPPVRRTGSRPSATVNRRKGIWSSCEGPRSGNITSWKTSHGPVKSITVAPSETRKATSIAPLAGG